MGKVSETIKSISKGLAGITRVHMFFSLVFIKDGSIEFKPEQNQFNIVCMKLKRDATNVTQYELFNAEINYERGLKVKVDVSSRSYGRSDGKKPSADEAHSIRKSF